MARCGLTLLVTLLVACGDAGDHQPAAFTPLPSAPPAAITTQSQDPDTSSPTTGAPPPTSSTTSPAATTPSTEPSGHGVALDYFSLLARNNPASAHEAADMALGHAAEYARYLAAAAHAGPTARLVDGGDVVTICFPATTGEDCIDYSDFLVTAGKVQHFSVDGRRLATRLWLPAHFADQTWCRWEEGADDAPCNFADPELDRNLYLRLEHAYIDTAGTTWVVWDAITGSRDLDVIETFQGSWIPESHLVEEGGVAHVAYFCDVVPSSLMEGSTLGLRMPKGRRGKLVCAFPGLERPGARTSVAINLVIDWAGRDTLTFHLPDLP